MSEVARNFNRAFDRGYQEFSEGCKTWQNPYQARYARNAWRAGWEKADRDSKSVSGAHRETPAGASDKIPADLLKSAPPLLSLLPSGEGDPSVTLGSGGADTADTSQLQPQVE